MDQQKYINTYVDKSVGMLHEYVSMVLQLRTQLHIANDLIKEKDQIISSLQEVNDKNKSDENDLSQARQSAANWENQYNAMKNKVSHMDTFANQINEMKQALLSKSDEVDDLRRDNELKNEELTSLKKEVSELRKLLPKETVPKKVINTKSKIKPLIIESEKTEETDDF